MNLSRATRATSGVWRKMLPGPKTALSGHAARGYPGSQGIEPTGD